MNVSCSQLFVHSRTPSSQFTVHSNLGRAINQVIKEFNDHPPELLPPESNMTSRLQPPQPPSLPGRSQPSYVLFSDHPHLQFRKLEVGVVGAQVQTNYRPHALMPHSRSHLYVQNPTISAHDTAHISVATQTTVLIDSMANKQSFVCLL